MVPPVLQVRVVLVDVALCGPRTIVGRTPRREGGWARPLRICKGRVCVRLSGLRTADLLVSLIVLLPTRRCFSRYMSILPFMSHSSLLYFPLCRIGLGPIDAHLKFSRGARAGAVGAGPLFSHTFKSSPAARQKTHFGSAAKTLGSPRSLLFLNPTAAFDTSDLHSIDGLADPAPSA